MVRFQRTNNNARGSKNTIYFSLFGPTPITKKTTKKVPKPLLQQNNPPSSPPQVNMDQQEINPLSSQEANNMLQVNNTPPQQPPSNMVRQTPPTPLQPSVVVQQQQNHLPPTESLPNDTNNSDSFHHNTPDNSPIIEQQYSETDELNDKIHQTLKTYNLMRAELPKIQQNYDNLVLTYNCKVNDEDYENATIINSKKHEALIKLKTHKEFIEEYKEKYKFLKLKYNTLMNLNEYSEITNDDNPTRRLGEREYIEKRNETYVTLWLIFMKTKEFRKLKNPKSSRRKEYAKFIFKYLKDVAPLDQTEDKTYAWIHRITTKDLYIPPTTAAKRFIHSTNNRRSRYCPIIINFILFMFFYMLFTSSFLVLLFIQPFIALFFMTFIIYALYDFVFLYFLICIGYILTI